jgi:hypothetical protein
MWNEEKKLKLNLKLKLSNSTLRTACNVISFLGDHFTWEKHRASVRAPENGAATWAGTILLAAHFTTPNRFGNFIRRKLISAAL